MKSTTRNVIKPLPSLAPVQQGLPGLFIQFFLLISLGLCAGSIHAESFVTFESGQVRPIVLTPNGQRLLVTNTPDNRLEIYDITADGLEHAYSVPVGMEPVAVAAFSDNQAWVVNHLSDSVSIVWIPPVGAPQPVQAVVIETVLVGDEPRDIVFAGPNNGKAFVTTAHRGQNSPLEYKPFDIERRADVWVIDAKNPQEKPDIVTLFGDTPRPLATNAEGSVVYAGILHSGNQTSVVGADTVDGRMPPPLMNVDDVPAPDVGQIIKYNGTDWVDAGGKVWSDNVRMSLPDFDVFAIDAMADPPVEIDNSRVRGVGTTLFNMVTNPATGAIYVSNIEARNHIRFEGPGGGGSTVRGHFIENRISVIQGSTVKPRHLNKHINYETFPGTPQENAISVATPTQMVVSNDGATLYLAAFGSSKIAVYDAEALEADTFLPSAENQILLSGGGPSGIALDELRKRLYVLTRFDNAIAIVDLSTSPGVEVGSLAMFNPEPPEVVNGRPFLYDASYTSSRGDSSCAGCHIFGDLDHLGWDLGNPDGEVEENPNPVNVGNPPATDFHPMKGPMTTQSLRGMAGQGPMHWRGDRTGGSTGGDPMDEEAAFMAFNGAFEDLLGRTEPLSDEEMLAFTNFALEISYPPNPVRALDNSLTEDEAAGAEIFFERPDVNGLVCNDCHVFDRSQGFFGTNGLGGNTVRDTPQEQAIKVPHLRNMYTKVGFNGGGVSDDLADAPNVGGVVRGFGYTHDGARDTLPNFHRSFVGVFSNNPLVAERERREVSSFVLASDSNLFPIVGQQMTFKWNSESLMSERTRRLRLLQTRSLAGECELIAKGTIGGQSRGLLMRDDSLFYSDRLHEPPLTTAQLLRLTAPPGNVITFTCVPPGSGERMALDRDEDGFYDGDELDAGSNPSNPESVP
jgi:DNA-binding beta-propeller fold protein YncE